MSSRVDTRSSGLSGRAAVLVPGALLALLSTTVVGAATPAIAADLDVAVATTTWVTTAFLLAAGFAIPMSGWLVVRLGVRGAWLAATAVFALGALASALAPTIETLALARALQGLGGGALEPIMLSALAAAAGPARMGSVMGAVGAAMGLGPMAGPAIGGLIADALGWRMVFGVVAALAALVLAGSWIALPRGERAVARLDVAGLVLVAAASVASLASLTRIGELGHPDLASVAGLALGAALLAGFVVWARRRGAGAAVDISILRIRGVGAGIAVMGLLGAAIYPVLFGLPQYLMSVVGIGASAAGLASVPFGVGTLLAMPIAGRLSDRVAPPRIVVPAALVASAAFAALAMLERPSIVVIGALALGIGLGLGAIGGPTVGAIYRALPAERIPDGSAAMFLVNQLAGAVGVAVLATLLGGGSSWPSSAGGVPFWVSAVAAVAIAATATRLRSADRDGTP